jgi:tRNA-splicing ligase RtcB
MIEYSAEGKVLAWTDHVQLDYETLRQAQQTAALQYIFKHVALMPDAHLGIGATVGSVVPLKGAVVPSAVGVDIGCGMLARHMPDLPLKDMSEDELRRAFAAIHKAVPVGFEAHQEIPMEVGLRWESMLTPFWLGLEKKLKKAHRPVKQSPVQQLGTMGGGNHFIELSLDENDEAWLVLHSGSRGVGNRIGQYYIKLAQEQCKIWGVKLPNRDLAYFPEGTPFYDEYLQAMEWAQNYAYWNRRLMQDAVRNALYSLGGPWDYEVTEGEREIHCHHNYIATENHFGQNILVTRKGAVRAREGDMGIIPSSMKGSTFIVRGKGEKLSFNSCSHGAGRKMSRRKAKEQFTQDDLIKATEGVVCRKDAGVIDEIPGAYKDIADVMKSQEDLVEVVHTLRQVVNVKG